MLSEDCRFGCQRHILKVHASRPSHGNHVDTPPRSASAGTPSASPGAILDLSKHSEDICPDHPMLGGRGRLLSGQPWPPNIPLITVLWSQLAILKI